MKETRKHFTKNFVSYPILSPEDSKEFIIENLKRMREENLAPWDVKKWDFTYRTYKEYCDKNAVCKVCGKVFDKKNLLFVNLSAYCDAPVCKKVYEERKTQAVKRAKDSWSEPERKRKRLKEQTAAYLKKTGYKWPSQNPEIKAKKVNAYKKKTGYENPSQNPEIQKLKKSNSLKKWGTLHPSQSTEVKKKIALANSKTKDISKEDILKNCEIQNSNVIVDYSKLKRLFNIDIITLKNLLSSREILYITKSKKRSDFENFFCENIPGPKIQNDRQILDGLELDIFIPSVGLAIECNGLMFHSQGISKHSLFNTPDFDKNYHLKKTLKCKSQGIQLFHIFEGEDLELWLSMIHNKLGLNTKVYARKCQIVELSNAEVREFLLENHLQGFCNAKISLGLIYGGALVSVMTFGKPRFNKKYEYELLRFCSLRNHSVVGGASKLWKYFLQKYSPKSVISYANLRFSDGKIYEMLGFKFIKFTTPNYFYFKNSNILESRVKYQKHKLQKLHEVGELEYFNPDESEAVNMFKNGYRRIFDCGNLVYEYQNS